MRTNWERNASKLIQNGNKRFSQKDVKREFFKLIKNNNLKEKNSILAWKITIIVAAEVIKENAASRRWLVRPILLFYSPKYY